MNDQVSTMTPADHDMLIKLNENVNSLRDEIRSVTQAMSVQLTDHEARVRVLEASSDRYDGSLRANRQMIAVSGIALLIIEIAVMFYVGTHH